ncbi:MULTISPECIES: hypothetical protein [Streptomyces]|uniref:hypothetical protein n=1 Tax=Streptomyces TaxID=1883 RepID=UPI00117EE9BB|nr:MULTISPECIES: hypothetical protein [Streptomyces]MYU53431.1 hypothetical protein [Streptomyces sp. SID7805]
MDKKISRRVWAALSVTLGVSFLTVATPPALAAGGSLPISTYSSWADKKWEEVSLIDTDKGWSKSLYATDAMIINSTGQRLNLISSNLPWGEWRSAPPKVIEPGELVHAASNGKTAFSGTEAYFVYGSADGKSKFSLHYDNPVGKNSYKVVSEGDVRVAARDYANKSWIPRANATDRITSSDFGGNNWTSEAFEIGTPENLPGKNLPAAKFSGPSDLCENYKIVLRQNGMPASNPVGWWQSGGAGALAGAMIGSLIYC